MNLRDYLLILRRRKWIGILVLAATLGSAATLTTFATNIYQSSASIFVGPQSLSTEAATQISIDIAQRLTKTYARMVKTLPVAERAVQDSDLTVSARYVLTRITATPIEDTLLIEVRAVDADPVQAANMANATAEAFVKIASDLTTATGSGDPVVPVTVFENALIPNTPVSPNRARNMTLGAILGLVAGIGMMFAAEYLDVAVRGPDDVERLVQLPVLALIPRVSRDDLMPRRVAVPRTPRARAPS